MDEKDSMYSCSFYRLDKIWVKKLQKNIDKNWKHRGLGPWISFFCRTKISKMFFWFFCLPPPSWWIFQKGIKLKMDQDWRFEVICPSHHWLISVFASLQKVFLSSGGLTFTAPNHPAILYPGQPHKNYKCVELPESVFLQNRLCIAFNLSKCT
jgi:hypothetical protein